MSKFLKIPRKIKKRVKQNVGRSNRIYFGVLGIVKTPFGKQFICQTKE